jgi:hypothetical protein
VGSDCTVCGFQLKHGLVCCHCKRHETSVSFSSARQFGSCSTSVPTSPCSASRDSR